MQTAAIAVLLLAMGNTDFPPSTSFAETKVDGMAGLVGDWIGEPGESEEGLMQLEMSFHADGTVSMRWYPVDRNQGEGYSLAGTYVVRGSTLTAKLHLGKDEKEYPVEYRVDFRPGRLNLKMVRGSKGEKVDGGSGEWLSRKPR